MGATTGDIWGRWPAHISNRRARNPLDLAPNLATLAVELRTGNGRPGGRHGGSDAIEAGVHQPMVRMHDRLAALGIEHVWDDYGPGAHDWPYWADDLAATLPGLLAVADARAPAPTAVTHLAFEPSFTAWGWHVALDRPSKEPTTLAVDGDGFTLRGSGRGAVTSDDRFVPGAAVRVEIDATTTERRADGTGRVTVEVDLGPANPLDIDDRGPDDASAAVTVDVRLRPA